MEISDEEGYLLTIGICCLTEFFSNMYYQKLKNDRIYKVIY